MKLIYGYADYRIYIRDFIEVGGSQGRPISGRALSLKAGFKSSNYISLIIDGKRNLTNSGAIGLAEAMDLTPPEMEYFFYLVSHNQSESRKEKQFFKQKLESLSKHKPKVGNRTHRGEVTSAWYIPIALMLAVNHGVDQAMERITHGLGFTTKLAEKAIKEMLESNMLILENEQLRMNSTYYMERDSKSLKKNSEIFMQKHTQLLQESVQRRYSSDSKHLVSMLGGLKVRREELFSLLEKTTEACAALVNDDPAEEVFVVHLHCQTLQNYLR